MEKMKFKLPTWEEGRILMKQLSSKYTIDLVERDADLYLENPHLTISCHFDDRGFSYFVVKYSDPEYKQEIESWMNS